MNSRTFIKKKDQFSEKAIHNPTDSAYTSNPWKIKSRKSLDNTNVGRFLQGIWFHMEREDSANKSRV